MRKADCEGRRGKQEDGTAGTCEAKVPAILSANGKREKTGAPRRDRDGQTSDARIDSASARGGRTESEFAERLRRESSRRGLDEADQVVVVSDGAAWIRNCCEEQFGGQKSAFVFDFFHACEYLAKVLHPDEEREKTWYQEHKQALREAMALP